MLRSIFVWVRRRISFATLNEYAIVSVLFLAQT
jgi:hypothetical protein